jgi:Fic family protein
MAYIEDLRKKLRHAVQTPKRWPGLLRRVAFARAIRGSNSIEGINVSIEDAMAAADGDEPFDAKGADWQAVNGYRSALTYVLQLAEDPYFRYSIDLLRSLHFMMLQHDLPKRPGRWRHGPISVVNEGRAEIVYRAPDADEVPALMNELVKSLNRSTAGMANMIRAAMAHLNLAMMHPFADGNGRMSRCLQTLVLARSGTLAPEFSNIEEYLGHNTRDYYDVLLRVGARTWNPHRDARPWIRFCLTAHYRQGMTVLRRMRQVEQVWNTLEIETKKRGLPDRTVLVLSDAALGLRVRNSAYRKVADISDQVAGKDLRLLVAAGLICAEGERRGRFYRGSPSLQAIWSKYNEAKSVPDPFLKAARRKP